MSWAADRVSTRPEDIAYSLMGIFDVNMPLLYGEKFKAFTRLQEQIIRATNDPTILLWGLNTTASSLLAGSPANFRAMRGLNLLPAPVYRFDLVNSGIETEALLTEWKPSTFGLFIGKTMTQHMSEKPPPTGEGEYFLLLQRDQQSGTLYRAGIARRSLWKSEKLAKPNMWTEHKKFLLSREKTRESFPGILGFEISATATLPIENVMVSDVNTSPQWESVWRADTRTLSCKLIGSERHCAIRITCNISRQQKLYIDLGFNFDCKSCVFLHHERDDRCLWEFYESFQDINEKPTRAPSREMREQKWTRVINEKTGDVGFFFCNMYEEEVFAAIPEVLKFGAKRSWIVLVPPYMRSKDFWKLQIVYVRPESSDLDEVLGTWLESETLKNENIVSTWRRAL